MSDESRLKAYQAVVESRLEQILPPPTQVPQTLHQAMRYSALAPGKRIRPSLSLASAEAVGGDPREALDAACAAELIHCFSLIHDDLPSIDDDDLRRGRPTCHKVYGEAMALLAGDALFALAFDVASVAHSDEVRSRRVVAALARASGSQGLVGGEVLDVQGEGAKLSELELQEIHRRKTGALISASCQIGGIVVGARADDIDVLRRFGDSVGLAFQVADDVLNEVGEEQTIGKAVGTDRVRGKATYPGLIGVQGAKDEAARLIALAMEALDELNGDTSGLRALARLSTSRSN